MGEKIAKIGLLAGSKLANKAIATVADIGANTVLGTVEDVVKDYAKDYSLEDSIDIQSNFFGALGAKVAGFIMEGLATSSKKLDNADEIVSLEKRLETAKRRANNNPKKNPNANRNQKVKEAEEAIENARAKKAERILKAGVVAGAPSGGAIKEVIKQIKASATACFVAGTLVSTNHGFKFIENLRPGDKLLTRNEFTGDFEIDSVSNTIVSFTKRLYHIKTSDSCDFLVTLPHSFFINDGIWKSANKLKIGDKLWSPLKEIKILSIELIRKDVVVYNIVMHNNHNY